MRTLTHWISPVQGNAPQTVAEVVDRARRLTPAGWLPKVLIPAVYGDCWQADRRLSNTCGMEIRPADAPDLGWIKDRFDECGFAMAAWGVPRSLSFDEGLRHGLAASIVDGDYTLDLEPYEGFLEQPYWRGPEEFIAGYRTACSVAPHVSVVPQYSGIDVLGAAWGHWAMWARTIRPQTYWTDGSQLHPKTALPYLVKKLKEEGLTRRIVPIYPHNGGDELAALLKKARSDRDIWVLG